MRKALFRARHADPRGAVPRVSIVGTLIACVTIVLITVAIVRHVNHKQDVAWCYDHGYAYYATKDGFCVGARGKLIKVGLFRVSL